MGAVPVIGTASSDAKLARPLELGLDVGIAYQSKDFRDEVARVRSRAGVDVIVDFVGASYFERNLACLAPLGRLIVIGLLGGITADLNLGLLLNKRLRVLGTVLRSRTLEEKALATRGFEKSVLPHLAAGRLKAIVDRVFPFSEVVEAHRYMETNANIGKIVLEVSR